MREPRSGRERDRWAEGGGGRQGSQPSRQYVYALEEDITLSVLNHTEFSFPWSRTTTELCHAQGFETADSEAVAQMVAYQNFCANVASSAAVVVPNWGGAINRPAGVDFTPFQVELDIKADTVSFQFVFVMKGRFVVAAAIFITLRSGSDIGILIHGGTPFYGKVGTLLTTTKARYIDMASGLFACPRVRTGGRQITALLIRVAFSVHTTDRVLSRLAAIKLLFKEYSYYALKFSACHTRILYPLALPS
jgi:hypothetical protein